VSERTDHEAAYKRMWERIEQAESALAAEREKVTRLEAERDRAHAKCEREQAEKRDVRGEKEFFKLCLEAILDTLRWNAPGQRWLVASGASERFNNAAEAARIALMDAGPAHGKDLGTLLRRLGKWPTE
jgi:multidrug resistance efflux pump